MPCSFGHVTEEGEQQGGPPVNFQYVHLEIQRHINMLALSVVGRRATLGSRHSSSVASTTSTAPLWRHSVPVSSPTLPTSTDSSNSPFTAEQVTEISRLRHERPLHWTYRRLAERFSSKPSIMARVAPQVKYLRQVREWVGQYVRCGS
jgi:hypothetical protein